jgi:hypothetical protein
MSGGGPSWDVRARDAAPRGLYSYAACFSAGTIRGWRSISCKRPPRRSTTCYDHARGPLRTMFCSGNRTRQRWCTDIPTGTTPLQSRRRCLAPPFQRDDYCGSHMKHITSSSQTMHGQFQVYFRGSDRAMTHTCQSTRSKRISHRWIWRNRISVLPKHATRITVRQARGQHTDTCGRRQECESGVNKYVGKLRKLHAPRATTFHRFDLATRSSSSFFCG